MTPAACPDCFFLAAMRKENAQWALTFEVHRLVHALKENGERESESYP